MKKIIALPLLLAPLVCNSQEVSCRRPFMPASSKTVCASPELSQQDMKVGTLSRRAEFLDPNYSKDSDEFWQNLKKCDGESTCIANLYAQRIEYLQKTIENGRALTPEEDQQAQLGDKKAEQRFADQEDERKKYASQSAENDATLQPEKTTSLPDNHQDPAAPQPAQNTHSANPEIQTHQATAPEITNSSPEPNEQTAIPSIIGEIWRLVPWWAWAVVAAVILFYFSRKKCPRCGKRGKSREISRDFEGSTTEYRDENVQDKHEDASGKLIKTVTRTEQRAVKVDHYTVYFCCDNCQFKWKESQSE